MSQTDYEEYGLLLAIGEIYSWDKIIYDKPDNDKIPAEENTLPSLVSFLV